MQIDVITIFPDMVRHALDEGIIGRAVDNAVIEIGVRDLRAHTTDRHRTVDDVPFGGGPGMVLKPEPLFRAVQAIAGERGAADAVVLMSPQGRRLTHAEAARFSGMARIVVISGRYEGVDERVVEALVTDEISIGDYVLTGGELPALVFIDAVARLVPGVVGDARSVAEDSFAAGVLDHPHYTRPAE
ncbi:MAG: tRNA (guanosine(37)-N1)-methyltransferase TrmD, partial [Acidobacteriota bacterium]|nr:tRNA (guanosine(37)-N1)-methyltransferase TrmD [Acidobacteriota bacterium]